MNNSTIKTKPIKCKGIGRAKGYPGCNQMSYKRTNGLCRRCLIEWSLTTEQGNEYLRSIQLKAKKKVKQEEKQRINAEKESIKTKSYFEKQLQKEVNKIVRLIDIEQKCISCDHGNPFTRQKHASHFHSVGSNPSLRYHLDNIHTSCSICNNHLSGNIKNYRNGLIDRVDFYYLDYVETEIVEKYQYIKLSIDDLKECIKKARHIIRDIENGRDYTRQEVNEILNIYR